MSGDLERKGGVLLVTGGDAVMSQVFREHGRAYWSAEFALILEKHGWLHFDTAPVDVLSDPEILASHPAVIVTWLPEEHWRPEYVESLRAYTGTLLLEGPFPPAVESMLGIRRCGDPITGASGPLSFSASARRYLDERFGETFLIGHRSAPDPSLRLSAGGDPNPLLLAPRESRTRPPTLGRDAFSALAAEPFEHNVGRAAISMVLAYRARFVRQGRFFDEPVPDAGALLACVRCLAAVPVGVVGEALQRLVLDAAGSNRPPVPLGDDASALARAIWGVALTEATAALEDPSFAERAKEILADVRATWMARPAADPELARWRLLLAVEQAELASTSPAGMSPDVLEAVIPASAEPATSTLAWLDGMLAERLPAAGRVFTARRLWLNNLAGALTASTGVMPTGLNGLTVHDLAALLGALARAGHRAAARRLWRLLLRDLYDTPQGLFMNATVKDGRLVPAMGFAIAPPVALSLLSAAGAIELREPSSVIREEYTAEQLAAWVAAPYTLQPYECEDAEVAVSLTLGERALPALWQRGNVIATSFQFLAHLVHVHTVEPLSEPYAAARSGDAIALEYLLIALLGSVLTEGEPAVVHTAPWPWGIRYGLTIRHDVDRILDEKQFRRLLEFERGSELAVSWFWLPDRLESEQLSILDQDPRHEIALHAVRIDRKAAELAAVARGATAPIAGEAIHGSGDGWLGHLTVRSASDAGLLYTEFAPIVADCPYARYPWIAADGRVGAERMIGVSYNVSIDGKLGVQPGSEGGPGIYLQLLNHPDLNFERLETWVRSLPTEGRLAWTCEQVARWWRLTHAEGGVSIRRLDVADGTIACFAIASPEELEDLELRIPCRPHAVANVLLDGHEAEWEALSVPEYSGIRIRVSLRSEEPRRLEISSTPATAADDAPPAAIGDGARLGHRG